MVSEEKHLSWSEKLSSHGCAWEKELCRQRKLQVGAFSEQVINIFLYFHFGIICSSLYNLTLTDSVFSQLLNGNNNAYFICKVK